jgi:hypothetical protein
MLEDAKVDGLLVRLNGVRDGLVGFRIDPANKVALQQSRSVPP